MAINEQPSRAGNPNLIQLETDSLVARRGFLLRTASAILAGTVGARAFGLNHTQAPDAPAWFPALPQEVEGEDVNVRMLRDVRRAMAKPEVDRRWIMVIDQRKCTGCHACTVACNAENKLPPDVVYRPVKEEEFGIYPNVSRKFTPKPCMQCDNPPCIVPCPAKGATYKGKDGLVHIDYDKCIGCGQCISACPYDARSIDGGDYFSDGTPARAPYEDLPTYDWNKARVRKNEDTPPTFKARKCHFCIHRVQRGMLPMCVVSCIGRATFFGDANDPKSVVSELLKKHKTTRMKEELGTKPRVYYIN